MRTKQTRKRLRQNPKLKRRLLLKIKAANQSILVAIKNAGRRGYTAMTGSKGNLFDDPFVRRRFEKLEGLEKRALLPRVNRLK